MLPPVGLAYPQAPHTTHAPGKKKTASAEEREAARVCSVACELLPML